jgi:LPXTG-site transpeptidase (sortase) family protein
MEIKHTQQRGEMKKHILVIYALGAFTLLTTFLFVIDFVPERPVSEARENSIRVTELPQTKRTITEDDNQETQAESDEAEHFTGNIHRETSATTIVDRVAHHIEQAPQQIIINSIGVNTPVITPASDAISVLDRALLLGAVHYPESGLLGENANVLIFGHSSHLPVIRNEAYKAFNEIQTLKKGEEIIVRSDTHEYVYEVDTVMKRKAEEARIYFDSTKPMLTLATCDNFGSKEERWIVTAQLKTTKELI